MGFFDIFNRPARHVEQLDRMMLALGVRSAMAELPDSGGVLRRAVHRCFSCRHSEECSVWLKANSRAEEAPEYCRNHDLFLRVARGR